MPKEACSPRTLENPLDILCRFCQHNNSHTTPGTHAMGKAKSAFIVLFFLLQTAAVMAADGPLASGSHEYQAENYEEALVLLTAARQQEPASSVAAFYLGLTHKQTGNFDQAAANYRDALTLTPPVNDAYAELIEMLFSLDRLAEARAWIAKAEEAEVSPAHIAFLKGLVLAKAGDNSGAIDSFEKAEKLDSTIAQACAFQIAMLQAKEGRVLTARKSLQAVINLDPNSEQAAFAKEYEDAIAKIIEGYRTWRFALGAALQYDDNVVSKPSTAITGLDITGEKDYGLLTTFRTDYTPLLDRPWSLAAQFALLANTYEEVNTHNVIAPTLSLIPGYNFDQGAVTLPLSYSRIWLKQHKYMDVTTVKPTLNLMFLPGHIGQLSPGYTKRDMLQPALDPDEDRDGRIYSLAAGYVYPFAEGLGAFNLRYERSKDNASGRNWDNTGDRFSAGLLLPLIEMVSLSVSGEILEQDYEEIHTAFNVRRDDTIYSGTIGLSWEMSPNTLLIAQYARTNAQSTIPEYDYTRDVYNLGVEYRF